MPGFAELVERLRAFLFIIVLGGIVLLDSASRIISMCIDGFLSVIALALVWSLLKKKG